HGGDPPHRRSRYGCRRQERRLRRARCQSPRADHEQPEDHQRVPAGPSSRSSSARVDLEGWWLHRLTLVSVSPASLWLIARRSGYASYLKIDFGILTWTP